jgi:hypothetical protein
MPRSKDLLDIIDSPVFYINWLDLSIVEEVLVPSCSNDWTWYSYKNDFYLMESDLFDTKVEAAEFLLGHMITFRKDNIGNLKKIEKELIDIICANVEDEIIG